VDGTAIALELRQKAAAGSLPDQALLGLLEVAGEYSEAAIWLRKAAAADQGDPKGEFTLTILNSLGQGRPVDNREAMKWARRAPGLCAGAHVDQSGSRRTSGG
jgi:TPR repeat protein